MNENKSYRVMVTETLQKTVIVEARSDQEAHQRVSDAWMNSECILGADSFQGVEFHVIGETNGDESEKHLERVDSKNV